MPATQVWTQTEDGYVTDFSALRSLIAAGGAIMPETVIPFPFLTAHRLKDYSDHSILGWYCFHNDKKYVVFND